MEYNEIKELIEKFFVECKDDNEVDDLVGDLINIIFDVSDRKTYELNNK